MKNLAKAHRALMSSASMIISQVMGLQLLHQIAWLITITVSGVGGDFSQSSG